MWPPESGLLSLGRVCGVANDDGRHLPALPFFAGALFIWKVLSSCLSCLGNTPISSATARSDFSGVEAIATAAPLPAGT
jgi:hypothetical protein